MEKIMKKQSTIVVDRLTSTNGNSNRSCQCLSILGTQCWEQDHVFGFQQHCKLTIWNFQENSSGVVVQVPYVEATDLRNNPIYIKVRLFIFMNNWMI